MAKEARQIEEDQAKFEAGQLTTVEGLYAAGIEDLDESILATIGITRDQIMSALPNHKQLFKKAYAKEKKSTRIEKDAFVRAFRSVYGKFLLNADPDRVLNGDNGRLKKTMEKVLRFKIDDDSVEGRTELEYAIGSLNLDTSVGLSRAEITNQQAAKEAELTGKEAEKASSERKAVKIETASGLLNGIDYKDRFAPIVRGMVEAEGNRAKQAKKLTKLEGKPDLQVPPELAEYAQEHRNFALALIELKNAFDAYSQDLEGIEDLETKIDSDFIGEFISLFYERIKSAPFQNYDEWKAFLNSEFKAFIKKLESSDFKKNIKKSNSDRKKHFEKKIRSNVKGANVYTKYLKDNLEFIPTSGEEMDSDKRKEYLTNVNALYKLLIEFRSDLKEANYNDEDLEQFNLVISKMADLLENDPRPESNYEVISSFLEDDLTPLMNNVNMRSFWKGETDYEAGRDEKLTSSIDGVTSRAKVITKDQKYIAKLKKEEKRVAEIEQERGLLEQEIEANDSSIESGYKEIMGFLNDSETDVKSLRDRYVRIAPGVGQSCDRYLERLDNFRARTQGEKPDVTEIRRFLDISYSNFFINEVRDLLNEQLATINGETADAQRKITELNAQIQRLGEYNPEDKQTLGQVLGSALPGVEINDAGDVTIRGFSGNFKDAGRKLDKAKKYLDSPEDITNLRDEAQQLSSLGGEDRFSQEYEDADIKPNLGIRAKINRLKEYISSKGSSSRPLTQRQLEQKAEGQLKTEITDSQIQARVDQLKSENIDLKITSRKDEEKFEILRKILNEVPSDELGNYFTQISQSLLLLNPDDPSKRKEEIVNQIDSIVERRGVIDGLVSKFEELNQDLDVRFGLNDEEQKIVSELGNITPQSNEKYIEKLKELNGELLNSDQISVIRSYLGKLPDGSLVNAVIVADQFNEFSELTKDAGIEKGASKKIAKDLLSDLASARKRPITMEPSRLKKLAKDQLISEISQDAKDQRVKDLKQVDEDERAKKSQDISKIFYCERNIGR